MSDLFVSDDGVIDASALGFGVLVTLIFVAMASLLVLLYGKYQQGKREYEYYVAQDLVVKSEEAIWMLYCALVKNRSPRHYQSEWRPRYLAAVGQHCSPSELIEHIKNGELPLVGSHPAYSDVPSDALLAIELNLGRTCDSTAKPDASPSLQSV